MASLLTLVAVHVQYVRTSRTVLVPYIDLKGPGSREAERAAEYREQSGASASRLASILARRASHSTTRRILHVALSRREGSFEGGEEYGMRSDLGQPLINDGDETDDVSDDESDVTDVPLFSDGPGAAGGISDAASAPANGPAFDVDHPPPRRRQSVRERAWAAGRRRTGAAVAPQSSASVRRLRNMVRGGKAVAQPFQERERLPEEAPQPMHPNFPHVEPANTDLSLPLVPASTARPTARECGWGLCAALRNCCGWCVVLAVLVAAMFIGTFTQLEPRWLWKDIAGAPGNCDDASNTTGIDACRKTYGDDLSLAVALTAPECNSCDSHYDGVCDEPPRVDSGDSWTGLCPANTDRFDCEAAMASDDAALAAQAAAGQALQSFPNVLSLWIFAMVITLISLVGCGVSACCCRCNAAARYGLGLQVLPVVSDFVFEHVRSHALALAQTLTLWLALFALANPFFNAKLCQQTFTISLVDTVDNQYNPAGWMVQGKSIWPSSEALPPAQAVFRADGFECEWLLVWLAMSRFLLGARTFLPP